MKKSLMAAFSAIIIIIVILILFTLHGRNARQVELDNALHISMKQSMDTLLVMEGKPQSEEEWKVMFLQSLASQIESESELTVNILEMDMDKGILSVEAVLKYKHIVGTEGTVSSQRTIVLEEYEVD